MFLTVPHSEFLLLLEISSSEVICLLRCLPVNLTAEDLASGVLRDRVKVGASLADVDPMNLDNSVSGKSISFLRHVIMKK